MISEQKIREILTTLNNSENPRWTPYEFKMKFGKHHEDGKAILKYMIRIGFLVNDKMEFPDRVKLTKDGLKFIEKPTISKKETTEKRGVDKVNYKQSEKATEKEYKILDYLKGCPDSDKESIGKVLGISPGSAYQFMKVLVEEGKVVMRKVKKQTSKEYKKEIQELPGSVKVHTINTTNQGLPTDHVTIGQILDLVWPYSTSAELHKPQKNVKHESILARFKDQKTLINVFEQLPKLIKDETRITIDSKKAQLRIPLIA